MTTARIAPTSRRTTSSWAGRASDFRRAQVKARGPEPLTHGPTGPVASTGGRTSGATAVLGTVDELWQSLVEVLETLDSQCSALLCTSDGFPVVGYGYCRADLVPAARLTGKMFVSGGHDTDAGAQTVETVALTSGATQTVIASVPSGQSPHLLSITADGVSMPVLQAWTHQTAVELGELLAVQP